MKILAIETSCDETAVALLDTIGPVENPSVTVLGNSLFSQAHLHEEYGGVYPNLAKREHLKNLPILLEKTLGNFDTKDVDMIAVTQGPGLEPALWTGITFAENLGKMWNKPVIPVDHMKGHIYSILFEAGENKLDFPALALLVSGGHTEIVLINSIGSYEILGRTLDDAVGEAFDKVARMLGLPYPGGPKISGLAEEARDRSLEPGYKFPRPMINSKDLNFSFSGLKTAVLYKIKDLDLENENTKAQVALAFEDAAIDCLIIKTRQALDKIGGVKTLIIAGGVASNKELRRRAHDLALEFSEIKLLMPTKELSTDNAIMIGIAAYVEPTKQTEGVMSRIEASGNLSIS